MMPLPKPKIHIYECKHHKWESWNHYGVKMPESGCNLSKDKFACHYLDASHCPNFERKEEKR